EHGAIQDGIRFPDCPNFLLRCMAEFSALSWRPCHPPAHIIWSHTCTLIRFEEKMRTASSNHDLRTEFRGIGLVSARLKWSSHSQGFQRAPLASRTQEVRPPTLELRSTQ